MPLRYRGPESQIRVADNNVSEISYHSKENEEIIMPNGLPNNNSRIITQRNNDNTKDKENNGWR